MYVYVHTRMTKTHQKLNAHLKSLVTFLAVVNVNKHGVVLLVKTKNKAILF